MSAAASTVSQAMAWSWVSYAQSQFVPSKGTPATRSRPSSRRSRRFALGDLLGATQLQLEKREVGRDLAAEGDLVGLRGAVRNDVGSERGADPADLVPQGLRFDGATVPDGIDDLVVASRVAVACDVGDDAGLDASERRMSDDLGLAKHSNQDSRFRKVERVICVRPLQRPPRSPGPRSSMSGTTSPIDVSGSKGSLASSIRSLTFSTVASGSPTGSNRSPLGWSVAVPSAASVTECACGGRGSGR